MRMTVGLIVFVCVFMTATSAHAYFLSGNDLVSLMREHDKAIRGESGTNWNDAFNYAGYVAGAYDSMEVDSPDGTTQGQITEIVAKFLKEHPELWAEPASDLVRQAITEAFDLKQLYFITPGRE